MALFTEAGTSSVLIALPLVDLRRRPQWPAVALANTDPVEELASHVGELRLITLHFPKFSDGRAYSQARLLRGRLGYEREWRADPVIAGGGEMLDQGVHLIDLARWFMGDFAEVGGHVGTFFWNMAVEDNGFALLKTAQGQVAWLHASCSEWKNLFCFEIFGRDGKLQIDGLGGSYGVERLSFYRMLPQMGPPETTIWEYPGEDSSWRAEFEHLIGCIHDRRAPEGTLEDALAGIGRDAHTIVPYP